MKDVNYELEEVPEIPSRMNKKNQYLDIKNVSI